jgi:hypothetical protein
MHRSFIRRLSVPISLLLAAAVAAQAIPGNVPIYCLDKVGVYQPVVRTDYARLQAAFRRQFNFTPTLTQRGPTSGSLVFRGGAKGAETITYAVVPHAGARGTGVALVSMQVRLRGVSQNLSGDEMCWHTFGIVNGE